MPACPLQVSVLASMSESIVVTDEMLALSRFRGFTPSGATVREVTRILTSDSVSAQRKARVIMHYGINFPNVLVAVGALRQMRADHEKRRQRAQAARTRHANETQAEKILRRVQRNTKLKTKRAAKHAAA